MIRTVVQFDTDVDDLVTGDRAVFQSLFDTFFYAADVFLRDRTANDMVDEFEAFAGFSRIDTDLDMTILSGTTGLLLVLVVHVDFLGERLFVGDLRLADVSLYLELTQESVDDDLKMQLAHAGDDRLTCVFVGVGAECWVFFCQLGKSSTHLFLTCFCLGFDRDLDDRIRELHGLENDFSLFVTECVPCCSRFQTYCCSDVAGIDLCQLLSLVGMHLEDAADPLFLPFVEL